MAELLVVRVRLRHRRLVLPPGDDGPDDRRHRALARAGADVRVARARPFARHRGDGRGLRGDAHRPRRAVGAGRTPGPRAGARGALLHRHGVHRPGRVGGARRRRPLRRRGGGGVRRPDRLRAARPLLGRAQGAHAVEPVPHRRALRAAGHHHPGRGHHRHRRRAQRAGARRGGVERRRRPAGLRRRRADAGLLVDVLLRAVGRAGRPPPSAWVHVRAVSCSGTATW